MPILIKNIEGEFFDNTIGDVKLIGNLSAEVQQEDYINLNGIVAYLQNLSKVEDTYLLTKPSRFGLKNNFNIEMITLEIDY